jgi:hypothetical protein
MHIQSYDWSSPNLMILPIIRCSELVMLRDDGLETLEYGAGGETGGGGVLAL